MICKELEQEMEDVEKLYEDWERRMLDFKANFEEAEKLLKDMFTRLHENLGTVQKSEGEQKKNEYSRSRPRVSED